MKRLRMALYLFLLCWPLLSIVAKGQDDLSTTPAPARAVVLNIDGPIGPATSDYVHRGIKEAKEMGARIIILRLDTPGGLDTAMRRIIKDILGSTIPVATFVAPSGARAASAGTYILYASHISAMAPGTNLGAATPVPIGGVPDPGGNKEPPVKPGDQAGDDKKKKDGTGEVPKDAMGKKIVNDAVAYIRSLAQLRGRNAEWAEKAVREAASLPAREAQRLRVIDVVADDVTDLLAKINGRTVKMETERITLKTKGLETTTVKPDWRNRFLSVITDPNVAYILMMLGIYGIFFELWNPGYVLPGVIGGICLVLALYALHVLPVNYAGLALIVLGIIFMVAEAFVPSFGALGFGGLIAFVAGSIILLDTDVEGFSIAWELIAAVSIVSIVVFLGVVYMAMKVRRRQVVSGKEEMIGSLGEAMEGFRDRGRVRVHSEEWQAKTTSALKRGQQIRVINMEGLVLQVEPVEGSQ